MSRSEMSRIGVALTGPVLMVLALAGITVLMEHRALADEGAADSATGGEPKPKAYSGNDLWGYYPGHAAEYKGYIDNLGYDTLKEEPPTKASAVIAAPDRLVWYSLSDGGENASGRFVCVCYGYTGNDFLYPADLSAGLGYTLVFLNGCKSASGDGSVFASKFGAKAYVGWKTLIAMPTAVDFAKVFFAALKGRKMVKDAVAAGISQFTVGSQSYRQVRDNIKILGNPRVVVDLTSP